MSTSISKVYEYLLNIYHKDKKEIEQIQKELIKLKKELNEEKIKNKKLNEKKKILIQKMKHKYQSCYENESMQYECQNCDNPMCTNDKFSSDNKKRIIKELRVRDSSLTSSFKGLFVNVSKKKNDFIIEITGKKIEKNDQQLLYKEIEEKNNYIFKLKNGFINAKKGNIGKYINHSCNPNCYQQIWIVKNKEKIGIFAKRDIQKNEEITIDYHWEPFNRDPKQLTKCYCGSFNCRLFIGFNDKERFQYILKKSINVMKIMISNNEEIKNWLVKKKKLQTTMNNCQHAANFIICYMIQHPDHSKYFVQLLQQLVDQ